MIPRSDCCDNCAKGVSTWQLNDLYYGFRRMEYNFTTDGRLLLGAIQEMEYKNIRPERECIIEFLRGANSNRQGLYGFYGKGKARKPYYWNALIDQFTCTEYIKFVPRKTYLTLSNKARILLVSSGHQLIQKPVGATFRYFKPKPGTPISNIQWNRSYNEKAPFGSTVNRASIFNLLFDNCVFCD